MPQRLKISLKYDHVLENYVKYEKNKAVIITKADYVISEYKFIK